VIMISLRLMTSLCVAQGYSRVSYSEDLLAHDFELLESSPAGASVA